MTPDMNVILREEESIFQRFNTFKKISEKCTAYVNPASQEVPHWNMVYPPHPRHRYSADELAAAESFYATTGNRGHVLVAGDEWAAASAETSEYFAFEPNGGDKSAHPEIREFSSPEGSDLAAFCEIVQRSFDWSDETSRYFRTKMETLAAAVPSRFWIIEHQGRPCGSASVFRTHLGSDFLFNFGVLPEFRDKDLGQAMLRFVAHRTGNRVYTYSHNPAMRQRLLPAAGFRSIETTHTVPLSAYRERSSPSVR